MGVHGSALTNAEFMRRGSSLIELRPFGFSGRESWPNIYMKVRRGRVAAVLADQPGKPSARHV